MSFTEEKDMNKTRYGWRWMLLLGAGFAWLSIGCSPQTLSIFLMPFTDTNIPPEHKLFAKDREITLVILSSFVDPPIHHDLLGADAELAGHLANAFRKRCADNKHRIKIVQDAQVRGELLNPLERGEVRAVEIGKKHKADYVLDLTIKSMTLKEPNFYPEMFRGRADIAMTLYKVGAKEGEAAPFSKEFRTEYPRSGAPIEVGRASATQFRDAFLPALAREITKVFIAYSPDERRAMD
jgi:hypothetical protein